MNIPNIKKRIGLLIIAVLSYIFMPVLLGFSVFSVFHYISSLTFGYGIHAIQIFIFLILVYGAFAWIKPSLVPSWLTKKIIVGIMCGIVIVMIFSDGTFTLEPAGMCTIIKYSQGEITTGTDRQSTEQNCIDSCLEVKYARYNAVSCEFEGIDRSWSKTPESLQGFKPAE